VRGHLANDGFNDWTHLGGDLESMKGVENMSQI
jgi:hypothetical protein